MAVVETVRHTGTIIHELHHVTAKVGLLKDAQSVGASILAEWEKKQTVKLLTTIQIFQYSNINNVLCFLCMTKHAEIADFKGPSCTEMTGIVFRFPSFPNIFHSPLESSDMNGYSC